MKGLTYGLLLASTFLIFPCVQGQTKIDGKITNASDSFAIPFVSVIIYQYQSNKILDYVQTDVEGFYALEIPSEPAVITLKTSHLSYHPYHQDIVIGSDQSEQIALSFSLKPKIEELQEVVVQGPIIVREDTIIYDVSHWTAARDQTLEEVLAKIPGFKIRSDGEIEVNGKPVNKVLIDGEEVTNSGARLLTRSIAPEDVESVEVRLDEKNDKLKKSLLDTREYVVLDIKLKEALNKSLFGKARVTLGYQNNAAPGGYLNAFSLKKKLKVHLFAEHDRFGEQTISLDQIKNIGAEAFQKMFELPADFQTLTEREAFNDEIYGFKSNTIAEKNIIGLSSRNSVSQYIDVYFGTYNAYAKDGKVRDYSQEVNGGDRKYQFAESQAVTDYSSKNKLELRLDKGKVKVRLDANVVLFQNTYKNLNRESFRNQHYRYEDVHDSKSFYKNFFFEYTPTNKLGVQVKASHSYTQSDHTKYLTHNNPSYANIFFDKNSTPVFDFGHQTSSTATNFLSEIMVQYRSKVGVINSGFQFQNRSLRTGKNGFNQVGAVNASAESPFTGETSRLNFQKWSPFIKHQIALGAFAFKNEAKLARIAYPDRTNNQKTNQFVEFKSGVEFSPSGFNTISVSLSKQISSFPMQKLAEGYDLTGFQTISIPYQTNLIPTPEYTLEIYGVKKFDAIDVLFDPAMLYGRTQNADRFLFDENPVITTAYDQLQAEYLLLTFPLTKSLKKIPLDIIIEPEWIGNQNQNIDLSGNFYLTKTSRTLLGLKLNTVFDDKPYNFFLYPKYSKFLFENELYESQNILKMFSVNLTTVLDFFNENLLITPTFRTITFFGNVQSDFTNVSLKIESPSSKFRWFVIIDNLLNNTNFTTQTIYPTSFTSENNSVFERHIKFGIEYKFK